MIQSCEAMHAEKGSQGSMSTWLSMWLTFMLTLLKPKFGNKHKWPDNIPAPFPQATTGNPQMQI